MWVSIICKNIKKEEDTTALVQGTIIFIIVYNIHGRYKRIYLLFCTSYISFRVTALQTAK